MANIRDIDSMLTISNVAYLLNVHINTVRRWSNQGILKSYRIGARGDRRFQLDDITNFLSQRSRDVKEEEPSPNKPDSINDNVLLDNPQNTKITGEN
jgi:excisionase family DNA binding protein